MQHQEIKTGVLASSNAFTGWITFHLPVAANRSLPNETSGFHSWQT